MKGKEKSLRAFFKDRKALKVKVIEEEAGVPFSGIYKFLYGVIDHIPEKHWPNLETVLKKYGWDCKDS